MNRKIVIFLLTAALICSVFAGCGEGNNSTEPETTNTTASSTIPNVDNLTFQEFKDMSYEQQLEIVESFETPDDYAQWLDKLAKEDKSDMEQQKDPTVSIETNENTEPTKSTEITETTEATKPNQITPENPDVTEPGSEEMTFLKYHSLSSEEQMAFINSFESPGAFVEWHTAAREEYYDSMIEIDSTESVDLNDIIGSV